MAYIYKLTILAFILCFFTSDFAHAQRTSETITKTIEKKTEFDLPPPDQIDYAHLNEMNRIYRECTYNSIESGLRDCKCYAMSYLEQRVKLPNVSQQIIEGAIFQQCFDAKNINDYYFSECVITVNAELTVQRKGKDPLTVCECFANEMANSIAQMRKVIHKTLQKAKTKAYSTCEAVL